MAVIDSLAAYLADLSDNFTLRRLRPVIIIIVLLVCALLGYEWYTAKFRLSRIDQELALLERLTTLGQRLSISDQQKLKEIYAELETQLLGLSASSANTFPVKFLPVTPRMTQTLLAVGSWCGLMLLLYFFATERSDLKQVLGGILLVAIPGVFVAAILPPFKMRWINYLYSVGHVILICVVVVTWQRRKVARVLNK